MNRDSGVWAFILALLAGLVIFALLAAQGNMASFSITILSGLLRAMLLFLVAAGLSLIFGLMDILNFAQGAYFMVGAYLAYDLHHSGGIASLNEAIPNPDLRFFIVIVVAVLVGLALGAFLERVMLRPLYDRPLFQLVLTFGVNIILLEAIKAVWGTAPYTWTDTTSFQQSQFDVFGQQFSTYRLFIIAIGFALVVLVALLLKQTRIGIIIRAGVENPQMVSALGINVRAVFTLVFTLGCGLAAFGGAVAAPFLGATLSLGSSFLLASIAVIVLGGLGSYEGTAIGSIIVGLAWVVMEQFSLSANLGSVLASITPMLMLTLVLLIRPRGLFGEQR